MFERAEWQHWQRPLLPMASRLNAVHRSRRTRCMPMFAPLGRFLEHRGTAEDVSAAFQVKVHLSSRRKQRKRKERRRRPLKSCNVVITEWRQVDFLGVNAFFLMRCLVCPPCISTSQFFLKWGVSVPWCRPCRSVAYFATSTCGLLTKCEIQSKHLSAQWPDWRQKLCCVFLSN